MNNRLGRIVSAQTIDFIERPVPPLTEHQVLIRIKASCICGSDLHIFRDRHPSVRLPVTIGHEFAGVVEAIGSGVRKVKPGDRVTVEPVLACGSCPACRRGEYGYCEHISFTYREGDGAMADWFVGAEEHVFPLPDSVSFEEGALTEPMAVALHAVRRADIHLGDTVAILGAGAIGILIAAICRRLGASDIVISDMSEFRLEMAERLSGARTVNILQEDICQVVVERSNGCGFDKSFECVGREDTLNQAIQCVKTNGLVTNVGIFERPQISFDASLLVKKELRIQGSQGYCWDFEQAIQLVQELHPLPMITHTFALSQLQTAFYTLLDSASHAIKVCIKPEKENSDG